MYQNNGYYDQSYYGQQQQPPPSQQGGSWGSYNPSPYPDPAFSMQNMYDSNANNNYNNNYNNYNNQYYNQNPNTNYNYPPPPSCSSSASPYYDQRQGYSGYPPAPGGQVYNYYNSPQSYPPGAYNPVAQSTYIAPNAFKNKKALLIGINYLRHTKGQLRGCINDVKNMYNFLTTHYYYPTSNIRVLTDDQPLTGQPTKANIIAGCRWLMEGIKPGEAVFFHFSGHGSQVADTSGDEDDGMDETILPVDYNTAGQILDDDLHNYLVKPLPEGARLTVIMDCCHSGTGLDLPFVYKAKGPKMAKDPMLKEQKKMIKKAKKAGYKVKIEKPKNQGVKISKKARKRAEEIQKTLVSRGVVVGFSGCMDSQTSADAVIAGQAQGALSAAFREALTASNFQLTYDQLLYKMRDFLAKKGSFSQVPQLSYGREPFNFNELFTM